MSLACLFKCLLNLRCICFCSTIKGYYYSNYILSNLNQWFPIFCRSSEYLLSTDHCNVFVNYTGVQLVHTIFFFVISMVLKILRLLNPNSALVFVITSRFFAITILNFHKNSNLTLIFCNFRQAITRAFLHKTYKIMQLCRILNINVN